VLFCSSWQPSDPPGAITELRCEDSRPRLPLVAEQRRRGIIEETRDRLTDRPPPGVPRIPASAGALIFNASGRLLILKPSYKKGWTIPGGQIDADGESPWEACRRETLEECGLVVERGRLICVDFLRPRPSRPGGVRFLFDCGSVGDEQLAAIRLQEGEIEDHRFAELAEATELLSGPLRRRVSAAAGGKRCIYLEEGRPLSAVG
jgi:8-oxo-dGTP pyrophosphatase MutT (NUDIX family)